MECDFAAYLFTLLCPLFTGGATFSIAHEYSLRNVNWFVRMKPSQKRFGRIRETGFRFIKSIAQNRKILNLFETGLTNRLRPKVYCM